MAVVIKTMPDEDFKAIKKVNKTNKAFVAQLKHHIANLALHEYIEGPASKYLLFHNTSSRVGKSNGHSYVMRKVDNKKCRIIRIK